MKRYLLFAFCFWCVAMAWAGPHTVQRGETYADIANLYAISLDSILQENSNTEAYIGYTIEVPVNTLFYDLGDSDLFRAFRYKYREDKKKGESAYSEGYKKQMQLLYSNANNESLKKKIVDSYDKAIIYGNIDALCRLGSYLVHGRFYKPGASPSFDWSINSNLTEFRLGLEYLQIAALVGNRKEAIVELAVACGHENSPIRNAYLCLSMLEFCNNELNYPVSELLCYMYENGYGITPDYLHAYVNCSSSSLSNGNDKTHRERILDKVDALPVSFESAKYGVGLDKDMLLSISLSYYHDNILEPEGLFWMHRAARLGNADANWALAGILQNKNFREGSVGGSIEQQVLYFAHKAADGGKQEAKEYVVQYENYLREKERLRQQQEEIRRQELAEKERQKREQWMNFASGLIQAAAQTYVAIESSKYQNQAGFAMGSQKQMPLGQMSDAQFMAHNQRAMEQILQYTMNKTYADWTGTPMVPTDMSAVNLGTDMSPGSPLWMWGQQQQIHRMSTINARMSCEIVAFYKRQADQITEQLVQNPFQPIAGYVDIDGNWISHDMVAAGMDMDHEHSLHRSNGFDRIRKKNHDFFAERYGYIRCRNCHGLKVCPTCDGRKVCENGYGSTGVHICPNCWRENGEPTGLCGKCGGTGVVYGLK